MESTDLSALGDEVKTYQDGSSNGFPLPPQNRPTQQSIAQHGLSERADAAEELQDSMDEAELRAQQYARMSPAEQYALQASRLLIRSRPALIGAKAGSDAH